MRCVLPPAQTLSHLLWLAAHRQTQRALTTWAETLFLWTIKPPTFPARLRLLKSTAIKSQPSKCSFCFYKCCLRTRDSSFCTTAIFSSCCFFLLHKITANLGTLRKDPCFYALTMWLHVPFMLVNSFRSSTKICLSIDSFLHTKPSLKSLDVGLHIKKVVGSKVVFMTSLPTCWDFLMFRRTLSSFLLQAGVQTLDPLSQRSPFLPDSECLCGFLTQCGLAP